MNVRQIRALHLLAKTGSVSETARLLHVSQPAISKMIRALEAEMGIPLLDHVRGKIQPRRELNKLMPSIERITQELSELRTLTEEVRGGARTSLVISCSTTAGMSLVLPACQNLLPRHPALRTTVIARGGRFSLDDLAANRADLAIEQVITPDPKFDTRPVAAGRMLCVIPRGHPLRRKREVRAEDLHGERIVLYPPKTFNGGRVHSALRERGVDYDPVCLTDSAVLACGLVRKLSLIGIIDSFMDVTSLYPDLVTKPFVPTIEFELHAIWRARSIRPALSVVIEELADIGRNNGMSCEGNAAPDIELL